VGYLFIDSDIDPHDDRLARQIITADLGIWVTDLSKSLPSLVRRVTMQIKKVVLPHPRLVVFLDINDTTGGRNRRMIVY